jgi:fructosamine-3-kinase
MNYLSICLMLALQLVAVSNSYGWGAGHDDVADLIVEYLPAEIQEFFGEEALRKITKWSHANDNFDTWGKVQEQPHHHQKHDYLSHGDLPFGCVAA